VPLSQTPISGRRFRCRIGPSCGPISGRHWRLADKVLELGEERFSPTSGHAMDHSCRYLALTVAYLPTSVRPAD
jgi:hypothetical protein